MYIANEHIDNLLHSVCQMQWEKEVLKGKNKYAILNSVGIGYQAYHFEPDQDSIPQTITAEGGQEPVSFSNFNLPNLKKLL